MRFRAEFEAYKNVTIEGIAEFHAAQLKTSMRGPLADVCSLAGGIISGVILYPIDRLLIRKSPEEIIQQSKSRIDNLRNC